MKGLILHTLLMDTHTVHIVLVVDDWTELIHDR